LTTEGPEGGAKNPGGGRDHGYIFRPGEPAFEFAYKLKNHLLRRWFFLKSKLLLKL
jgi:hypothetical protein